jgi:glycosyltransferase involved in cell wall biosynthesis
LKILLLNQCFYPDVASTSQHATDLARGLVGRGHEVVAVASRRKYDEPGVLFASGEKWRGVRIERLPGTGFGKGTRWRRTADFASFYLACAGKLTRVDRFEVVIAMTTPPLISYLAAWFVRLRGGQLDLWVMDLNPDQAVAAGWLKRNCFATRVMECCLRFALRQATHIIVLDRFMRERMLAKGGAHRKMITVPPWTHDEAVQYDAQGRMGFRELHRLRDKFVVMYSGNHSPCHPLDTLLEAAARLSRRDDIAFCFVGGGSEFAKVQRFACERNLINMLCLPYQPLDRLSASLSAADLHVVVMGDPFVGIIHPCKVYNILRLGIPFLYIGPPESHVTDLIPDGCTEPWMSSVRHGDVDAVVDQIRRAALVGPRRYEAEMELGNSYSQTVLLSKMVRLIEGNGSPEAKDLHKAEKSAFA